jgi:hypothetical protein
MTSQSRILGSFPGFSLDPSSYRLAEDVAYPYNLTVTDSLPEQTSLLPDDDWDGDPLLVVFFIPLPTSLGIPHLSSWRFERSEPTHWPREHWIRLPFVPDPLWLGERNFVVMTIWRPEEQLQIDLRPFDFAMGVAQKATGVPSRHSDLKPPPVPDESWATVIEATTPLLPIRTPDGGIDVRASLSEAFDTCLEQIAKFVRAYTSAVRGAHVLIPTRRAISSIVPFATAVPSANLVMPRLESRVEAHWTTLGIFWVNINSSFVQRDTGIMTEEESSRLFGLLRSLRVGNPFTLFAEDALASQRALSVTFDNTAAVIEAHIATEVLLDATLLVAAWEEGESPVTVASWFKLALSSRVRTLYSTRFGGSWDTTNHRTAIGRWARDTRDLRNSVVHAGLRPTDGQAEDAIRGMGALEDFVKSRLIERRKRYPRTALLLLGVPGFTKRDAFVGWIKRFIEEIAPTEPDWLQSYSAWADAFRREREKL